MFDRDDMPIHQQVLMEMEKKGFDKTAMDYARYMILQKKDINFAIRVAELLITLDIADRLLAETFNEPEPIKIKGEDKTWSN